MSEKEGLLEGKVAFITGAASGIGRGIAQAFAREGAVVIVADINIEAGFRTVRLIGENGGEAIFKYCDVGEWKDGKDCERAVQTILNTFGRIDILVNNVGVQTGKGLLELNDKEIERVTEINYLGPFKLIQAVARSMI